MECKWCHEPIEPCTHNPPPGAEHFDSKVTGLRYCQVTRGRQKEHEAAPA